MIEALSNGLNNKKKEKEMTAEIQNISSVIQPQPTCAASSTSGSSWDPSTLSTFWADVEIIGLCIALDAVFYISMGSGSLSTSIPDTLTDDLTSRLQQLVDNSQASPRCKELAQSSINIANSGNHYMLDCREETNLLEAMAHQTDIQNVTNQLKDGLTNNKGAFYLPQDDGTALFCLTIVAGTSAVIEYKRGNSQYLDDIINNKELAIVFPEASYEYLCNLFSSEEVLKVASYAGRDEGTLIDNGFGIISLDLYGKIWFGQQNWRENGCPGAVPLNEAGPDATQEWNTYVKNYGDPVNPVDPSSTMFDPNQTMPPYDPSAPNQMFNPYGLNGTGNDVLSKTYLMLDWMVDNPSNTNGAAMFLLYLSNLANAGYFGGPDGNAFSEGILSIQNSSGKTLVAECVDITMLQMCMNGDTADQADAEIDALFPGDDPVSVAVRAEADQEAAEIDDGEVVVPSSEEELQAQWNAYMTDPSTVQSIDNAEAELRTTMIVSCGDNIYAAILVLMLLLEAAGINSLDAYGQLSDDLSVETNSLNTLITEWNDGEAYSSPQAAQEWMDNLQTLQQEMDATFADDPQTQELIDQNFDNIYNQQAMLESNGTTYSLYVDSSGQVYAYDPTTEEYYAVEPNHTLSSTPANPQPQSTEPLTIGDQAFGYTDENGHQHTSDNIGLQDSFEAYQVQTINPNDPNSPGGISSQEQQIDSSLNALTSPLSTQSAAVGTEMQQVSSWIEMIDNTLSSTLSGSSGSCISTMEDINRNMA